MGEHYLDHLIQVRVNAKPAAVAAGCDKTFLVSVRWVELDDEGVLLAVRTPLRKIPASRLVEVTPELAAAVAKLQRG